jgi:hypothetical protein
VQLTDFCYPSRRIKTHLYIRAKKGSKKNKTEVLKTQKSEARGSHSSEAITDLSLSFEQHNDLFGSKSFF